MEKCFRLGSLETDPEVRFHGQVIYQEKPIGMGGRTGDSRQEWTLRASASLSLISQGVWSINFSSEFVLYKSKGTVLSYFCQVTHWPPQHDINSYLGIKSSKSLKVALWRLWYKLLEAKWAQAGRWAQRDTAGLGTHCSVSCGDYRLQTGKLMECEGEGKCKESEGSTNSWAFCLGRMIVLWIGIDYPEEKLGQVIKVREDGRASFGYGMYKTIFLHIKTLFRTREAQLNFRSDAKPYHFESCVNLKLPKRWGSTSYLNVLVPFNFPKMST